MQTAQIGFMLACMVYRKSPAAMTLVTVSMVVFRMSMTAFKCKEKRAPLEPFAERAPLFVKSLIFRYEREITTKEVKMEIYLIGWSAKDCDLIASVNAL